MNKISVIIPYYNNVDYIKECINSVLRQSCQPKEIIVINDGSSPENRQYLEQFSEEITIIDHEKNLGIAQARNTGANYSTGEYLAFLDADDTWEPNKNQQQQELLDSDPELAACHTGVNIFSKQNSVLETCITKPMLLNFKNSAIESHVVPSSFMLRRSIFEEIGGFDPKIGVEDYDLFLSMLTHGHLIAFIPQPLTWLRRDEHGNESAKWQYIFHGRNDILQKHWRVLYQHNGFLSLLRFFQRTCEIARWRARKPMRYLFMILALLLPSSK